MAQRRELTPHTAAIDLMRKKLLQKITDVGTARRQERTFIFFQEFRELADIGSVSTRSKRRESLFDFQVVEKTRKHAGVGIRSHHGENKYARYRTLEEVTNRVPNDHTLKARSITHYICLTSRSRFLAYKAPSGVSSCLKYAKTSRPAAVCSPIRVTIPRRSSSV